MLKKSEEKIKLKSGDHHNYLEMESKYLKDIKDLNDTFDEYKKHVERHMSQLSADKNELLKQNVELE